MIDIHVLTHSGTRDDWLEQCLSSMRDQPCTVHVVSGEEGHIGQGRAAGFSLGEHPYVGYVDSDDYVLPGAMAACLSALTHHAAVCTDEIATVGDVEVAQHSLHHLYVARREAVLPLLPSIAQLNHHPEAVLRYHLRPARVKMLGYVWRLDGTQSRLKIRKDLTTEARVLRELRRAEMQ